MATKADALLVVDVQEGFLNQYTRHIPGLIARLIQTGNYCPILFTRFVNSAGSPYHRLLDWHACETVPETLLAAELRDFAPVRNVFAKRGLMGMPRLLARRLRKDGVEKLALVGIDTDMCVLKMALDVFDLGIEPSVLIDCCASTAGLQAHLAGLAILSRNIGPAQLRVTGLGGDTLAAPD